MNLYNEVAEYPARWLRNLIRAGEIPDGTVLTRSVERLRARDVEPFRQVHLFAGIGGWPLALRLAGWPDDREVWTGSCPCQPYSVAGRMEGNNDARNLWPEFRRLVAERAPATIFGEQVASKAGREWLAGVRIDLEALGYAVGAADLCAASVGAPHVRQRLFWVAYSRRTCDERWLRSSEAHGKASSTQIEAQEREWSGANTRSCGCSHRLGDAAGEQMGRTRQSWQDGFSSDSDVVDCADGVSRRVEPGTFPLAHGVPARVGKLRAYGNAIVPQVAVEFIVACEEAVGDALEGAGAAGRSAREVSR